ncbi:hypothetical protein [Streptomyces bobili]|uniref:hypothetical protein n=1 Tax=Streptomyces bobili TaxID=67280 RepID=UPI003712FB5A
MLLDPPGWLGFPEALPHWPYVQAVDRVLSDYGIPPGVVRADRTGREHGETMYMVLVWDSAAPAPSVVSASTGRRRRAGRTASWE